MNAQSAREALATAFHAQQPEYRSLFGVTTAPAGRFVLFAWRNSLTGERGPIARVPTAELVDVTRALLDELQSLRESLVPAVLRKAPPSVGTSKPHARLRPFEKRKTA